MGLIPSASLAHALRQLEERCVLDRRVFSSYILAFVLSCHAERPALFSAPKVLKMIQQLWSQDFKTHPARAIPIDKSCTVLKLVVLPLSTEGEFHFLQALVSDPPFLTSFCEGISRRFRNTITYHQQANSDADTAQRLEELAAIAQLFSKHQLDAPIAEAVRLSGIFTSWTRALLELRGELPSRSLVLHLGTAFSLATARHGQPSLNREYDRGRFHRSHSFRLTQPRLG